MPNCDKHTLHADTVLINGNVITVDTKFSKYQALAVKNDRILCVGQDREVQFVSGDTTRIIDLKGATVLPGINDSHIHASLYGGYRPPLVVDISSPELRSIRDLKERVAKKAGLVQPGEWIRGAELNLNLLEECKSDPPRFPSRYDLDPVSPYNPVVLGGIPFRSCPAILLNTQALNLAGIDRDTLAPQGITIMKDENTGEPTGLVRGYNPEVILEGIIPLLTRQQKEQAIRSAMRELNQLGITSITEPGLGQGGNRLYGGLWDTENLVLYHELNKAGELTLRVSVLFLLNPYGSCYPEELYKHLTAMGTPTGFGNEWLRIAGIKLFADGIPPMKTAWMHEEYIDGSRAMPVVPGSSDEEIIKTIKKIIWQSHTLGFQVAVHATGNKAIDVFVDAFSEAEEKMPRGLRHYIIHGDFVTTNAASKMAKYDFGISVQPALMDLMAPFMKSAVGESKMADHLPLRLLHRYGVNVAGGSDAPVTIPDWRAGIYSAVEGNSERRISREDAVRMYTIAGAWQDHMENLKGTLEPGKLADLCILDNDLTRTAPGNILSLKTLMTMVGGKIVYDSGL